VDPDGRVEFVNPAGLRVLGYDHPSELIGCISHPTIHYKRPDGSPFPAEECPMLRPRVTGETVRVDEDWFVRRDGSMVPVAYSSAPLPMRGRRGAVVAFRDISDVLTAEALRRREAVDRTRLQELEASRARIVAAADAERRRVGRDLHDGAQQRLVHLLMTLQRAGKQLDADAAPEARATLDEAAREARAAIGELRDLVAGIHPAILTNRGLQAAVSALTVRAPVPVRIDVPTDRWPAAVESAAYFVVAEALTNAAKHAPSATQLEVVISAREGALRVCVGDDGPGAASVSAGSGLRGLEDRVAAAGGTLQVDSPASGGTTVRATLPLR
jgi:PAS domain S-box-containing protein